MYIVPILSQIRPFSELKQIWIFLERNGTHLIELDASIGPDTAVKAAQEFLTTNGMMSNGEPQIVGDIVFVDINPMTTELASFYTWREVPAGTIPSKEVWRSFFWISNKDSSDPLGVNHLLENTSLAGAGNTAFTLISSYLKTFH